MQTLVAAGLPVVGVSPAQSQGSTAGPSSYYAVGAAFVRVDWSVTPTSAQDQQAASIVGGFDFAPYAPRTLADIMSSIAALSASDRATLMAAVAAKMLRDDPTFARAVGVALDGDAPA